MFTLYFAQKYRGRSHQSIQFSKYNFQPQKYFSINLADAGGWEGPWGILRFFKGKMNCLSTKMLHIFNSVHRMPLKRSESDCYHVYFVFRAKIQREESSIHKSSKYNFRPQKYFFINLAEAGGWEGAWWTLRFFKGK